MKTRLPITAIALAGILLLASVLRLVGISDESLWGDETHTAVTIRESWWTLLWEPIGNNQPLHFLLLKAWTGLAGTSETALRFPSAVFGILTVGATFLLGRQVANKWVGIGAALLVAVAPALVWYSQEARSYSLQTFFVVAGLYFLVRFLDDGENRMLAGYVAMAALGLFSHFYFAIYIGGSFVGALGWLLPQRRNRDIAKLVAAHALIGLTLLPRIPVMMEYMRVSFDTHYSEPPSVLLGDQYRYLVFAIPRFAGTTAITWFGLLVIALAGFSSVISVIRAMTGQRPATLMLLVTAVTAPALLIIVGFLLDVPVVSRYLISSVPLWLILAADGVVVLLPWGALLHRRFLVPAAALVAILVLVVGIFQWTRHRDLETREDWRGVAKYVEEHGEPTDSVVADSALAMRSFRYYQKGDAISVGMWHVSNWPCESGESMWLIAKLVQPGADRFISELEESCTLKDSAEFPFHWGVMRFEPRG